MGGFVYLHLALSLGPTHMGGILNTKFIIVTSRIHWINTSLTIYVI